jgi:hypothetical protein
MDYAGFIRLIQFFDNSLFKMVKDFTPARANLSTGITISSPILERNKWVYADPSSTSEIESMDANLKGPSIKAQSGYGDMYKCSTMDMESWYTGEFTGSVIEYGDDWIERNFNPYLHPTASLTPNDINVFNHSDFNVLLNNVSASRLSLNRQDIEFIYGTTGSILTPAYLQDSNESLVTYNRSRYDGVKVSSLLYNTYTSASADYGGDTSYGKTAAIDKNVRQIGLFTEIVNQYFSDTPGYEIAGFTLDDAYIEDATYLGKPMLPFSEIEQSHPPDKYDMFISLSYTEMNKLRERKFQEAKN